MHDLYAHGPVTWAGFLLVTLCILLLYFLLYLLAKRLERGLSIREFGLLDRNLADVAFLVYGPVALLVLLATFVAIWPAVHGLVAGILLIAAFPYLRNYIAGRFFRLDKNVRLGQQLNFKNVYGTISDFGPTSVYVQHRDGNTRITYSRLLRNGYTVVSDPTQGGYFRLHVDASGPAFEGVAANKITDQLRNLLLDNPYVMPGFRIEQLPSDLNEVTIELQVHVHKYDHLRHLMAQLKEMGFSPVLSYANH